MFRLLGNAILMVLGAALTLLGFQMFDAYKNSRMRDYWIESWNEAAAKGEEKRAAKKAEAAKLAQKSRDREVSEASK